MSWHFGVTQSGTMHYRRRRRRRQGRASQDLQFEKWVRQGVTEAVLAPAPTGEHFDKVMLTVRKAGGDAGGVPEDRADGGAGHLLPDRRRPERTSASDETVQLNFAKIEVAVQAAEGRRHAGRRDAVHLRHRGKNASSADAPDACVRMRHSSGLHQVFVRVDGSAASRSARHSCFLNRRLDGRWSTHAQERSQSADRFQIPLMFAFREAFERATRGSGSRSGVGGERVVSGRGSLRRRGADEALLKRDLAVDLMSLVNTIDLALGDRSRDLDYVKRSILNFGLYDVAHLTSRGNGRRRDRAATSRRAAPARAAAQFRDAAGRARQGPTRSTSASASPCRPRWPASRSTCRSSSSPRSTSARARCS